MEGATSLPLKSLLPQTLMIALTAIAVGRGVGIAYLALSMRWWERFAEVIMNVLWAPFHLALLLRILKFNKALPEEKISEQ